MHLQSTSNLIQLITVDTINNIVIQLLTGSLMSKSTLSVRTRIIIKTTSTIHYYPGSSSEIRQKDGDDRVLDGAPGNGGIDNGHELIM